MKLSMEKMFMYAPSARNADTRIGIDGTNRCTTFAFGNL